MQKLKLKKTAQGYEVDVSRLNPTDNLSVYKWCVDAFGSPGFGRTFEYFKWHMQHSRDKEWVVLTEKAASAFALQWA